MSNFTARLTAISRFYLKILCFFAVSLVVFGPICDLVMPKYLVYRKSDTFVSDSLETSKKKTTSNKLLVGDSVARQLYDGLPGHHTIFLWQSASLLGQLLLIKNTIQANPDQIKEVIMVILPHTLMNNFDQPFTYLDIVRTLYSRDTKGDFDKISKQALFRFPLARLAEFSLYRMTDLIFYDYGQFNPNRERFNPYTFLTPYLSDISKTQLKRIRKLCRSKGIKLTLLPAPIPEGSGTNMERLRQDIRKAGLNDIFKGYFDKLLIFPESDFREDKIHLSDAFLEKNFDRLKKLIYTEN